MKLHAQPQPRTALTPRQAEVLEALRAFTLEHGVAPTLRELGAILGIRSTHGMMCHLDALEKKGAIQRLSCRQRGIRIVPPAKGAAL